MIAAEGYEQSQRLRGEGEAEAIRIYARRSGGIRNSTPSRAA